LPLYAIGVFVGFTISQTAMVRQLGRAVGRWEPLITCAVGAVLTGIHTIILLTDEFVGAAWIVWWRFRLLFALLFPAQSVIPPDLPTTNRVDRLPERAASVGRDVIRAGKRT